MKLLIVVPYTPNLIRVRPYQIIRALKRQQHEITLATLWSSEDERADLAALEAMGVTVIAEELTKVRSIWNVLRTIPTQRPLQANYCWHPELAQRLEELVTETEFDAVHIEHLRGALYGLHIQRILAGMEHDGRASVPVIWDSVDCISHLFEQAAVQSRSLAGRFMTGFDLNRTQLFEGYLVNYFGHIVTTSNADATALADLALADLALANLAIADSKTEQSHPQREAIGTKIKAIPNGVDLDYFQPNSAAPTKSLPMREIPDSNFPRIVFSGKMSYHANITAALYLIDEVMPIVWSARPDAQVQIVGKDPTTELMGLTEKHGVNEAGRHRVVVTGTVPDLRPYLRDATVSVAPVPYGAGIQNKVLEAMACGAPVVASAQAASGVAAKPGVDMLVAHNPQEFGQAILTLLDNSELRTRLSNAGRQYVEGHHSWNWVADKLVEIYSQSEL